MDWRRAEQTTPQICPGRAVFQQCSSEPVEQVEPVEPVKQLPTEQLQAKLQAESQLVKFDVAQKASENGAKKQPNKGRKFDGAVCWFFSLSHPSANAQQGTVRCRRLCILEYANTTAKVKYACAWLKGG